MTSNSKIFKRIIAIVLIILFLAEFAVHFRPLIFLGNSKYITGDVLRMAACTVVMPIVAFMLIKDMEWRKILMPYCISCVVTAVSFLCDIPYIRQYASELAEKPDEQLPGLNALASIGMQFEIITIKFLAVVLIITAVGGVLVFFGKKGKTLAVVMLSLLLIANLLSMDSADSFVDILGLSAWIFFDVVFIISVINCHKNEVKQAYDIIETKD